MNPEIIEYQKQIDHITLQYKELEKTQNVTDVTGLVNYLKIHKQTHPDVLVVLTDIINIYQRLDRDLLKDPDPNDVCLQKYNPKDMPSVLKYKRQILKEATYTLSSYFQSLINQERTIRPCLHIHVSSELASIIKVLVPYIDLRANVFNLEEFKEQLEIEEYDSD